MEAPPTSPSEETDLVNERVVVVAGGEPWSGALPRMGTAVSYVIAADSGVELALELGLPCDVVVGDMDSASPEALAEAERQGARIDRHPIDKESTDLELAIDLACATGTKEIVVIGGAGGRTSHLIGNTALLASDEYADITIRWLLPETEIYILRPQGFVEIEGTRGDLLSLIPIGGDATGITSSGLRWPLHDDTLRAGATRGISNEFVSVSVSVSLTGGKLLVIHEVSRA